MTASQDGTMTRLQAGHGRYYDSIPNRDIRVLSPTMFSAYSMGARGCFSTGKMVHETNLLKSI
jgi:hypothetical protein